MAIKVILFGQLKEMAGVAQIMLENVLDTDQAWRVLIGKYPAMEGLPCNIAVDQQIIHSNTVLQDGQELAFLPPFSGG